MNFNENWHNHPYVVSLLDSLQPILLSSKLEIRNTTLHDPSERLNGLSQLWMLDPIGIGIVGVDGIGRFYRNGTRGEKHVPQLTRVNLDKWCLLTARWLPP